MKTKINRIGVLMVCGAMTLGWGPSAHAINNLQLSIIGGVYNDDPPIITTCDVDTTCAELPVFDLTAYLKGDLPFGPDNDYYISAAVFPKIEKPDGGDFGSFDFNGTTINVTGDMVFGKPPLAELCGGGECLPEHSVFETYYKEFLVHFTSDLIDAVDISAGSGVGYDPSSDIDGCSASNDKDCMRYLVIPVDVSLLDPAYSIHFDLYSKKSDGTIDLNAPFSHDAQSPPGGPGGEQPPENPIPEIDAVAGTGALTLLAGALMLLGERRRRNAA